MKEVYLSEIIKDNFVQVYEKPSAIVIKTSSSKENLMNNMEWCYIILYKDDNRVKDYGRSSGPSSKCWRDDKGEKMFKGLDKIIIDLDNIPKERIVE
jgi:hypothetical protein